MRLRYFSFCLIHADVDIDTGGRYIAIIYISDAIKHYAYIMR